MLSKFKLLFKGRLLFLFQRLSEFKYFSLFFIWFFKPVIVFYNTYTKYKVIELGNELEVSLELKKVLNKRKVIGGPFTGQQLPPIPQHIKHYNFASQILGTYESELHDWIKEVIENQEKFKSIINIGSGGGYYVVGFALYAAFENLLAIDTSEFSNEYLKRSLKLNNQSNSVLISTDLKNIESDKYINGRNLWFIDCEGCEKQILLQSNIDFSLSDIIVETHEFVHFDIVKEIEEKFCNSHSIEFVESVPDMKKVISYKRDLLVNESKATRFQLLAEKRNVEMKWMYLKTKSK